MAILSDRDRQAVTDQLAKLAGPVRLVTFGATLGSDFSADNERLMREVAACSDQITLEIYNLHLDREKAAAYGVERVPTTIVEGARDYGIRFIGIPSGYEFSNLIDGLLVAASGEPQLSPTTIERVKELTAPVHLQVFATPT
jgi:alkyl hydroperoxide reductase subunit AhpF